MGQAIGHLITDIFGDPEKLYINIRQMMAFKKDFSAAVKYTSDGVLLAFITGFVPMFKGLSKFIYGLFGYGEGGAGFLEIIMSEGSWIIKGLRLIGAAFSDFFLAFIPSVIALTYFFQILSARGRRRKSMMPKNG